MNNHTPSVVGLALSLSCVSVGAYAAVIDFDPLAPIVAANEANDGLQRWTVIGHTYSEDGFTLNAFGNGAGGGWWAHGPESSDYAGSIGLVNGDGASGDELVASDGSAFNMTSIDLATWNGDMTVVFEGLRPDNSTVTESVFVPAETQHNFQAFQLTEMTGVTRIRWGYLFTGTINPIKFDNIIVTPSAVPIPAAVWLFGSGLLGLIGIAKRKTA